MATMFELTATLRQLLELAGSDDPDEQQVFADTLEAVSGEIGVKADSYKYVMDQLEGQAQMTGIANRSQHTGTKRDAQ